MREKIKDKMFIQIGLQRNGKIVKNEQYSILHFFLDILSPANVTHNVKINIPFYKRIFLSNKRVAMLVGIGFIDGYETAKTDFVSKTAELIRADNFGKGSRRKNRKKRRWNSKTAQMECE